MIGKTDHRLRLSLRRLEVFVATARTGSTRAAAEQVSRSQSAASTSLVELEAALGAPLFDRVGRRLVINDHGRILLPSALQLLDDAAGLEALFAIKQTAPLRMAASFTIGEYLLPDIVARWKRAHPSQPIHLDIANSSEVIDAVVGFDVDVGFIEGRPSHPAIRARRWRSDELVVVAAPGHPLASGIATVRQLSAVAWVVREQGSGTREATDRWLVARLRPMLIELELGSSEAVKRVVAAGFGLGCLSRHAVAEALELGRLVEVKTALPPAVRALLIVVHRQRRIGAAAQAFVDQCMTPVS